MSEALATQTKTFEEWLNEDAREDVNHLREQKESYDNNQENEYVTGLNLFVQRLKNELFGNTTVFSVKSYKIRTINSSKILFVEAYVMEPLEDGGYKRCPHPLQTESDWVVSSIIAKDKFSTPLAINTLFEAKYEFQSDERHIDAIIKFRLDTYKEVEELFIQSLNRLGYSLLARSAQGLFGSDVEKVISTKFLEFSHNKEMDYEINFRSPVI